jgi:hypothetical protein
VKTGRSILENIRTESGLDLNNRQNWWGGGGPVLRAAVTLVNKKFLLKPTFQYSMGEGKTPSLKKYY